MHSPYVLQNLQIPGESLIDITISDNQIQKISQAGSRSSYQHLNMKGLYVSSGWIDLHVHALSSLQPYGDDIDEIGIKQGVTTIVDAGSCGADNIHELYTQSLKSKTNVLAYLNISRLGLTRIDELSELHWLDREKLLEAVSFYEGFIVGLKARMSNSVVKNNAIEPLNIARNFSRLTNMPLMVHIGSAPPKITDILDLLEKNDIITHFLNGKDNNLFPNGAPLQELLSAISRGVHLDVGHGSASFSFPVAEVAKKHNIQPFTISSDIYKENRENGPVYSLASVASKFLHLGYSLKEIIHAITTLPANRINKPELGELKEHGAANLTLFNIENADIELVDSAGERRYASQQIIPKGVVINGELIIF